MRQAVKSSAMTLCVSVCLGSVNIVIVTLHSAHNDHFAHLHNTMLIVCQRDDKISIKFTYKFKLSKVIRSFCEQPSKQNREKCTLFCCPSTNLYNVCLSAHVDGGPSGGSSMCRPGRSILFQMRPIFSVCQSFPWINTRPNQLSQHNSTYSQGWDWQSNGFAHTTH